MDTKKKSISLTTQARVMAPYSIFKVGMCLPSGPYVSDEDVKYIVETIKNSIE